MSTDNWIGLIHSTRPKYAKGASDMTVRARLRLSMLRKRGRIMLNQSGEHCVWQVMFSKPDSSHYADGSSVDFGNHDAYRQIKIDWRGHVATDSMTMMQRAINAGDEQLINLFQSKINNCTSAVREDLGGELFKDGEASGRENAIHGLETFLNEGTVTAADTIAQPSDTYGLDSLSTAVGNQGGAWSSTSTITSPNATIATDWPHGNGDREYDFNSPKLLNSSSTNWGTGSTAWEDNCWRVISQGITWLTTTGGADGAPDLVSLAPDLFQGYKNHHEALRRVNVPHRESSDLGFSVNVLNQDGVAISSDFDCPAATGYIENLNHVTVASLMPQLMWFRGPDQDPRTLWSYLMAAGFFGNCQYKPKYVAKIYPYA
jgi:hypothetical protein